MANSIGRRRFLKAAAVLPAAWTHPAFALAGEPRRLRFLHTHTSEKLDIVYADDAGYIGSALAEINQFLRDFRTGDVHPIDPALLDLLTLLQANTGNARAFEIISGYRSPATNHRLRQTGSGVARKSFHMQGKAIDVRLPGTSTDYLRRAAVSLRTGGVGYYPRSDFLHIDTGRTRSW